MSSSNQVRITAIPETVYGELPGSGEFFQARFTSDSLSGTPETTESQQIRTDRLSSGQIVTGLTLAGEINGELAKEDSVDEFIESAMLSTWAISAPVTPVDLTLDAVNLTLTRATGDFTVDVKVGDVLTLSGFINEVNNTEIMVSVITSATDISYVGPKDMVDEIIVAATFEVADKIDIGITQKSFSMEKAFLDLDEKAINYGGMLVSNMGFNIAYGAIVNYVFGFSGNFYDPVDLAADFFTDGRTIAPAGTTNSMNGSIDLSFIGNGSTGIFGPTDFCIQSIDLALNNNYTPQTCIGELPPQAYSEGTAQVEVSLTAYLSNETWSMLERKLTQEPFELGFNITNADGFYSFYIPALQVTGDDPASAGINQDVLLTLTGVAKVGANGEKSLTMYKGV